MVTRAGPVILPHPPDLFFDALFAAVPETDLQVTWADRQLRTLVLITARSGVGVHIYSTVYVRPAANGHTTVVVQTDGGGERTDTKLAGNVLRFVNDVAAGLDRPR